MVDQVSVAIFIILAAVCGWNIVVRETTVSLGT
jgi:hypothetical protein